MSRQGDFGYGSIAREYRDNPSPAHDQHPDAFARGYQQGSANYSSLVDEISSNIFTVSNNATTLERTTRQIGTSSDSIQLRDRIHATEQNTNKIINNTVGTLRQLSGLCRRNNERQQKLQYERLRNEFKESVQRYNTLQKTVAERVRDTTPLHTQTTQSGTSDLIGWGETVDDEDKLLQKEQHRAQMQAQKEEIEEDVAMLQEREDRIRQLESDILDINEIFRDLGTLVHEQGEVIDTIEANVENAHDHVEAGNQELVKAAKYQRKARKKICILIIVLLVVAGIIGLVIYLSIR